MNKKLKAFYHKAMNPNIQIAFSLFIVISSLIGWPVSLVTFAKDEPPLVVSLSWLALIYSGYSALVAAQADKHIRNK